jgi:hypothetical protein
MPSYIQWDLIMTDEVCNSKDFLHLNLFVKYVLLNSVSDAQHHSSSLKNLLLANAVNSAPVLVTSGILHFI